jgi:hypothetical protein
MRNILRRLITRRRERYVRCGTFTHRLTPGRAS